MSDELEIGTIELPGTEAPEAATDEADSDEIVEELPNGVTRTTRT